MKTFHHCGPCLYRSADTKICSVLKKVVNDDDMACQRYADSSYLNTCELCGRQVIRGSEVIFIEADRPHFTCANCAETAGTCHSCINIKDCRFDSDPSPIPKVVQRQIRQGNVVQIASIQNPERIKITCQKGCECWDPIDSTCRKQEAEKTCKNYKIIWE